LLSCTGGADASGLWTALAFAVVGAIHLMPIAPVFVPETLSRLYGIAPDDSTLLVLLRHRALLLALVGILCLWASWAPGVRPAALLAAAINVAGFLGFYALYGNPAGALRTIAIVDLIALPPLVFAAWTTLARG
jgi:hypothetical protein